MHWLQPLHSEHVIVICKQYLQQIHSRHTMPDLEMGQAMQIGLYLASGCILGSAVIALRTVH